jgi:hypothetical protein
MAPKKSVHSEASTETSKKGPPPQSLANLKPYKKGQSGNPNGRPHDPPELKKLKNLTKAELVDVGNMVVKGDFEALKRLAKNPKATVLQRMLAAVAQKVIEKGDMHSLDILLNRMVGRVKEEVALTSNIPQVVVNLPSNGREAKDDEPKAAVSGL